MGVVWCSRGKTPYKKNRLPEKQLNKKSNKVKKLRQRNAVKDPKKCQQFFAALRLGSCSGGESPLIQSNQSRPTNHASIGYTNRNRAGMGHGLTPPPCVTCHKTIKFNFVTVPQAPSSTHIPVSLAINACSIVIVAVCLGNWPPVACFCHRLWQWRPTAKQSREELTWMLHRFSSEIVGLQINFFLRVILCDVNDFVHSILFTKL